MIIEPAQMSNKSKETVLLVEDSEDDVFLLTRALSAAGVELDMRIARDGKEAIAYLSGTGPYTDRIQHPFPRFVFLDLKLPYRSGIDILRWAASEGLLPQLFFIMLTSSDEPSDVKASYALGARTYLVKPPTKEMILDIVRSFNLQESWLKVIAAASGAAQLGLGS